MRKHFIICVVLLCVFVEFAHARDFDPFVDGFRFENWGESGATCIDSCDFSWDLYRRTYLGINPTHNCLEAPLDCAFYEIFKNCAEKGNCGGMSLLSLALYKYGGYMGFCSPASFYKGKEDLSANTDIPESEDLHRAINILQARQFSAAGIENLIDVVDASQVNDAVVAFNKTRDGIASGDYPVLSIANSAVGELAHTVIPYKTWEPSGGGFPKYLYIWDSVVSFEHHPDHYQGTTNTMVINSPTDWTYVQSSSRTYTGSGTYGGWCFTVPMSVILPKSRQPMALDMVFDALMTVFVSGPAAAATQISDDEGHQLYKTDSDTHLYRSEFETDPVKRLKGVVRWPWYAAAPKSQVKPATKPVVTNLSSTTNLNQSNNEAPGELYFARRTAGNTAPLNVTISGSKYKAVIGMNRNLIEIEGNSTEKARDTIKISGLAGNNQSVVVQSLAANRILNIRQVREVSSTKDWRSVEIKNLKAARNVPITIDIVGNLDSFVVSSRDQAVSFDANIQQRISGQLTTKSIPKIATTPGDSFEIAPSGVRKLSQSEVRLLKQRITAPVMLRENAVVK